MITLTLLFACENSAPPVKFDRVNELATGAPAGAVVHIALVDADGQRTNVPGVFSVEITRKGDATVLCRATKDVTTANYAEGSARVEVAWEPPCPPITATEVRSLTAHFAPTGGGVLNAEPKDAYRALFTDAPPPVVSVHEWGLIEVRDGKVVHTSGWASARLKDGAPPATIQYTPLGGAASDLTITADAAANVLAFESDAAWTLVPTVAITDDPKGARVKNLTKDVMIGQTFVIHRDDDKTKTRVQAMFAHPDAPVVLSPDFPLTELYIWPSNALRAKAPFDELDVAGVETQLNTRLFGGAPDPAAPADAVVYWVTGDALKDLPAPTFDPATATVDRAFLVRVAR